MERAVWSLLGWNKIVSWNVWFKSPGGNTLNYFRQVWQVWNRSKLWASRIQVWLLEHRNYTSLLQNDWKHATGNFIDRLHGRDMTGAICVVRPYEQPSWYRIQSPRLARRHTQQLGDLVDHHWLRTTQRMHNLVVMHGGRPTQLRFCHWNNVPLFDFGPLCIVLCCSPQVLVFNYTIFVYAYTNELGYTA